MSNGFYLSSKNQAVCRINPYNFSLNDRIYSITKTHTFYDTAMNNKRNYAWGFDSINADTALGMPNVH